MGRRKRLAEAAQSSPAESARADRAGQPQGACIAGAQSSLPQHPQRQFPPAAGGRSTTQSWLLLVAIVLEAAWLALLLMMVLRRW
jgi:hypothetical protein